MGMVCALTGGNDMATATTKKPGSGNQKKKGKNNKPKAVVNRLYKDNLFCSMFTSVPSYKVEVMNQVAPEYSEELKDITEDDIELNTLQTVFVHGVHNDVSFIVQDKFMVLIEAQSTWSPNIILRIFPY